jgi:hypothetical protein
MLYEGVVRRIARINFLTPADGKFGQPIGTDARLKKECWASHALFYWYSPILK